MGFSFRKSIKLGGGVRLNLSKSGIGASWGVKGFRVTKPAKGKARARASIPGTGLSYSTSLGASGKRKTSHKSTAKTSQTVSTTYLHTQPQSRNSASNDYGVMLFVTILLGWLGVHRFLRGQIIIGILYLFTFGLCSIGWILDIVAAIVQYVKYKDLGEEPPEEEEYRGATVRMKDGNEYSSGLVTLGRLKDEPTTNEPSDFGIESFREARRQQEAQIIEWQNAVIQDCPNRIVTTETQRRLATESAARDDMRIIDDSFRLINVTTDPDVFFSRWELLIEQTMHLEMLRNFMMIPEFRPPESSVSLKREKSTYIQHFLSRYFSDVYEKAETLKTEHGKIGRYQRFYDSLQPYYDKMQPEHIEFIETKNEIYVAQADAARLANK